MKNRISFFFFFSSRRLHTIWPRDWSSDVCSSDLDANAAAWAEFVHGAARDVDDMVCVTVGTGIGGGIVIAGELLRGAHGVAAEIGHLRVEPGGHRCGCGARGCWEQYASGSALVREGRAMAESGALAAMQMLSMCGVSDPAKLTGPMITGAAAAGDAFARELLDDLGRWLGEGLASVATLFDPSLIVVGGGVSARSEEHTSELQSRGHLV